MHWVLDKYEACERRKRKGRRSQSGLSDDPSSFCFAVWASG